MDPRKGNSSNSLQSDLAAFAILRQILYEYILAIQAHSSDIQRRSFRGIRSMNVNLVCYRSSQKRDNFHFGSIEFDADRHLSSFLLRNDGSDLITGKENPPLYWTYPTNRNPSAGFPQFYLQCCTCTNINCGNKTKGCPPFLLGINKTSSAHEYYENELGKFIQELERNLLYHSIILYRLGVERVDNMLG